MPLVGKRDSEDLQYLIDAALQPHIVLYYCHKAISDYGTIYLDTHGVFKRTPEPFDSEVLFYPFEEQLHAPTVTVKFAYQFGFGRQIVGEKYICRSIIRLYIDYFP